MDIAKEESTSKLEGWNQLSQEQKEKLRQLWKDAQQFAFVDPVECE